MHTTTESKYYIVLLFYLYDMYEKNHDRENSGKRYTYHGPDFEVTATTTMVILYITGTVNTRTLSGGSLTRSPSSTALRVNITTRTIAI